MKTPLTAMKSEQAGAFLLEALVGLLIFSLGVLGIVALQAQSIRFTSDAEIRAEVTYLANSLISTMWSEYPDPKVPGGQAAFRSNYDSSLGGAGYTAFTTDLGHVLGAAITLPVAPLVTIDDPSASLVMPEQSKQSSVVHIKIVWQMPGDSSSHNYELTGIVGRN